MTQQPPPDPNLWQAQVSYGQPAYTQPPGYGVPPTRRTNGLAIASLITGLTGFITCGLTSILAVVFGHVALGQIRRDGTDGHGMALAGVVLGWILTGLWIVYWSLVFAGVVAGIGGIGAAATPQARTTYHRSQPAAAPPAAGVHTVTFEATGQDGADHAGNVTTTAGLDIKQDSGVPLPYSKELTFDDVPRLYLWVQNGADHGSVTCRIKVDGKTIREDTADGPYGVCTVSADA
jgi:hypothetical protein